MEPIIFEEALLNGIKQDILELQKRINNLHEQIEKSVSLGRDVDQHLVSERLHLTQLLEKKLKEKNELEGAVIDEKENPAGQRTEKDIAIINKTVQRFITKANSLGAKQLYVIDRLFTATLEESVINRLINQIPPGVSVYCM